MSKYLATYLNDHLMGATTGVELVRRIANEHKGTELGAYAASLGPEIEADRDALLDIMRTVGASPAQLKVAAGWALEKVGRLKPNAELLSRSPLTPLVELEGLSLGLEGKRARWMALAEVDEVARQVGRDRLTELTERAERQRADVEQRRLAAARGGLAS
jgi:hypothetical protein